MEIQGGEAIRPKSHSERQDWDYLPPESLFSNVLCLCFLLKLFTLADVICLKNSELAKLTRRNLGGVGIMGVRCCWCFQASATVPDGIYPRRTKQGISIAATHHVQVPFHLTNRRGPSELGETKTRCWVRECTGVAEHEYSRPRVTTP